MNTKKILALLLAMVMLCTAFVGCSSNDTKTDSKADDTSVASTADESKADDETSEESKDDTTPVGTGAYPGTTGDGEITVVLTSEPPKMNSLTMTDTVSFTVTRHIIENLVMLDETDNVIPGMAESWEISEDGLDYTFKIREGATWTNGEPVTANDFEFAWKTLLNPDTAAEYAYFIGMIKGAEAYTAGEGTVEDVAVKATDDYTLEVTLAQPTAYFMNLLAFGSTAPINETFYNEVGHEAYSTDPEYFCTNGAYNLVEWIHDDSLVLEKNPEYWNADAIEVEKITLKIMTDTNSMLNAFQANEVDMTNLSGDQRTLIEQEGYPLNQYNDGSSFYLQFNTTVPGLNNVKVRKAFERAIDKQAYIDSVQKNDSVAATGFTPEAVTGLEKPFNIEVEEHFGGALLDVAADVDEAKKLFEEGLAEENLTVEEFAAGITYVCDDGDAAMRTAEFMQEQVRTALGFEMTVESMPFKSRLERSKNMDYSILFGGWGPDYNDPNTFLDLWLSTGGNNQTGYANPEYDKLLNDAAVEADLEARMEMFYQLEEIVCTDLMVAPVYWRKRDFVTSEKISGGVVRTMLQDMNLKGVKLS